MRALVTGCAGFIGSHLTEALLARGDEVVGVDSLTGTYAGGVPHLRTRRLHRLDLARDPVASLVAASDVVFHLAGEPGVRASFGAAALRHVRANVVATRRLLAAARCAQRLVHASSSSVYGDAETLPTPESAPPAPLSPYAETKLAAERACLEAHARRGVDAVALRFFTVYGPRQRPDMAIARFVAAARSGGPLVLNGDGAQTRDFTYVGDVVEALLAAADAPAVGGLALNVGGGAAVALRDVVARLGALAGRPLDIRHAPPQRGDVRHTAADTTLARERLGWTPRTRLEDGLAAQWAQAAPVATAA